MVAVHRRWFLGAAAVGLAAFAGCNPQMLYFLTPEQRNPAKLAHLAHADKRKAPRIVILTHHNLDIDTGLIGADRDVAAKLATELKDLAKAYKDNVEIMPQSKVDEYKNRHPDWKHDLVAVGEHFKATHVAYIEFLELAMREPKKVNMYHGKCHAQVQLYDVKKGNEPPLSENMTYKFPDASRDGIPEEDMHASQFRQVFVERIAKNLMPYFANHPRASLYSMDK